MKNELYIKFRNENNNLTYILYYGINIFIIYNFFPDFIFLFIILILENNKYYEISYFESAF